MPRLIRLLFTQVKSSRLPCTVKRADSYLDLRDAAGNVVEDVLFGETDDAPAQVFERNVFLFVFEFLEFARMGFAVVTFDGEIAVFAEDGEVEAENPPPRRLGTSFRKGGINTTTPPQSFVPELYTFRIRRRTLKVLRRSKYSRLTL